jgi:hypothetical protein
MIKAMAARTGLVAERQGAAAFGQPFNQFADVIGTVEKIAEFADLAATSALCDGHRDSCFMDIQSNKKDIGHQARPPCLRLGAGRPAQPSIRDMHWDGPPSFLPGEHTV